MNVRQAADILRAGELAAFPTETVYGLGADATKAAAVARIFAAKGRPATNPLIVHIADIAAARRYAATWPDVAEKLAKTFWPGPLTLVLPKTADIVPAVTPGLPAVGLRVPRHALALELLRAFDGPVAAPSANRSNRISPTTAQHVREELGDAVAAILDGGPCGVGIESTVLDLSRQTPTILRPGGVSRAEIEQVIGPVRLPSPDLGPVALSPGQLLVHYAPRTPAFRIEGRELVEHLQEPSCGAIILETTESSYEPPGRVIRLSVYPRDYARKLYAALRQLDGMGFEQIVIEMPPDRPEWLAVRDRIYRATRVMDNGRRT